VAIPDQRRNRCFCETVPAAVVRRVFGVCYEWVSNQGTHFKNQVMAELQHVLGAHHHFTTARCPWANSIVMHHLLCLFRSCRSEWRMATNQWVETRLVIMLVLNQLTSPSIGNVSPVTAMSGRPAMALTDLIALPGSLKAAILEEVAVAQKERSRKRVKRWMRCTRRCPRRMRRSETPRTEATTRKKASSRRSSSLAIT
jgi:hypothetical protein